MNEILLEEKKGKRIGKWFKKNWKYLLGVCITIGLMGYLIWRSEPDKILESIIYAKPWYLVASAGLTLVLFTIKTARWQFILRAQEVQLPFFKGLKLVLIGTFGSAITPAKVGDILRAFYLSKEEEECKIGTSVFSVVFDRILDLVGIFIIVGVSSPFILLKYTVEWYIPVGIAVTFVVFVMIIIVLFSEKIVRPIVRVVLKIVTKIFKKEEAKEKINITTNEIIDDFFISQKKYNWKKYLVMGLLSVTFWIILGLQGNLLLLAFNGPFDPLIIISVLCIAAIVAIAIPTSISGIGVRDLVIVQLLNLILSVEDASSLSLSMSQTLMNVLIPGIIGALLIIGLGKARDRRRNQKTIALA